MFEKGQKGCWLHSLICGCSMFANNLYIISSAGKLNMTCTYSNIKAVRSNHSHSHKKKFMAKTSRTAPFLFLPVFPNMALGFLLYKSSVQSTTFVNLI